MLFNFRLRETDAIVPWGSPDRPTLSWFGLSDGWYWLDLDGHELFRVHPGSPFDGLPYVDYQVVRLWEDVLDLVPTALEPVPADIAAWLRDPEQFLAAVASAQDEAQDRDDETHEAFCAGLSFWHARRLDSGHLVDAPRLWLWRDSDVMNLVFRSRPQRSDAAPIWHEVSGEWSLPVDAFIAEVRAFDRAFMSTMGQRVDDLRRSGGRSGVDIDLDHLLHEQTDRATWLDQALARSKDVVSDWSATRRMHSRWLAARLP